MEFLFNNLELEIVQDEQHKLFENKIFRNYNNQVEIDQNYENNQML